MATRRDELVAVATRLFAERGYHGTSMADLAEAMGVQKGSLYSLTESKQELLVAVTREGAGAFHGALDPIVPYGGGGLNSVAIANQNLYKGHPPAGLPTPPGVEESMRRWAAHNGCDADPDQTRVAPEVRSAYF